MKTIVITSQKGGSGKTMLTSHLAVEAERAGDGPVWVVDTDRRQATLTRWYERRPEGSVPRLAEIPSSQMAAGLAHLASEGAAYCLIDTAPTIGPQTAALVACADLVVIPVRPSPSDLWSVAETVDLVHRERKPFVFVITQANPQATITGQAVAALSEYGRVMASFVNLRVAYAAAMTGGSTAPELAPRGPTLTEMASLWKDVKSSLKENIKTLRKVSNG